MNGSPEDIMYSSIYWHPDLGICYNEKAHWEKTNLSVIVEDGVVAGAAVRVADATSCRIFALSSPSI